MDDSEVFMDGKRHLLEWKVFLERYAYGRPLKDDDRLFPSFRGDTCRFEITKTMSHDMYAKVLGTFVTRAGLKGHFTLHCFRRGGAQFRFEGGPKSARWPLWRLQAWGNWASGEQVCRFIQSCHSQTPPLTELM